MALLSPTQFLQIHSPSSAGPLRRKSSSSNYPSVVVSAAGLPDRDLSSARSPSPGPPAPWERKNALTVFASAAAVGGGFLFLLSFVRPPSDGGGGGGGGGGWGWGSEGGGFWDNVFSPLPASANEEDHQGGTTDWDPHGLLANIGVPLTKLSGLKRYKISEILFFDRRRSITVPAHEDSLFEMVSIRTGGVYTKRRLERELDRMASFGMFESVDLLFNTKPDGSLGVTVSFVESHWQAAKSFRCVSVDLIPITKPPMDPDMTRREMLEYNELLAREYKKRIDRARPCLLPVPIQQEMELMLREQGELSARLLQRFRDRIEKWYHDEGYIYAHVNDFGNLGTTDVVCEVLEGDITELSVEFHDKLGYACEGDTQLAVIRRHLPKQFQEGHVFNIEAGKQALRNIRGSLSLFSRIEVDPLVEEKSEGGIIVRMIFTEKERKRAEVSAEWSLIPGLNGVPTLASIQPGGTVLFEISNIDGLNRSMAGFVTSSNLLNTQDDFSFDFEYVHPYIDGVANPRNRILSINCFNTDKLSPVFIGGPAMDGVPPVWIIREGLKANITEKFTSQSKFISGLVVEEITALDMTNRVCTRGIRPLPTGEFSTRGPPTTLSGTGIDRRVYLQANITRDNTKFINGALVGARDIFQLDQGLGIGSKSPFFNRHQLTLTRFLQLKPVEVGAGKPRPPVLVLYGHYGGCVGDLPTYDAFILGGPYSVRGYNMGELGACRNILELAVELRIPVRKAYVYAFAEHGNDLGSSEDVKGKPTQFFHRAGRGSSYGAGVKLGNVRVEYAVDHNRGIGAIFLSFGERF